MRRFLAVSVLILLHFQSVALAERSRIVILHGSDDGANPPSDHADLAAAASRAFRRAVSHSASHPATETSLSLPPSSRSDNAAFPRFVDSPTASGLATPPPAAALNQSRLVNSYVPSVSGFQPPCDLTAERALCLFGGQKVIVPDATPKGLLAWYRFDEAHPLDSSRRGHHGVSVVPHGPGRGGFGSSARFEGETWFEVPTNDDFATTLTEGSLSFWAFFPHNLEDKYNSDCPMIYMGREFDAVFSLMYNPETRKLSANRIRNFVSLNSWARIRHSMWYHFALTADASSLRLYVNGIEDARADVPRELQSQSAILQPSFQFYSGAIPWAPRPQCSFPVLIDDLRVYNRALLPEEIAAESFPSLGMLEPGFAIFGCDQCLFDVAVKACPPFYHLCYKAELLAGAISIARKMDWTHPSTPFWENDIAENHPTHEGPPIETRAGLCCAD